MAKDLNIEESSGISFEQFRFWLMVSMGISIGVGMRFATLWPMRIGIKAFEEREF